MLGWDDGEELPTGNVYVVLQTDSVASGRYDLVEVVAQLVLRLGNHCLGGPARRGTTWLTGCSDPEGSWASWDYVGEDLTAATEGR